MASDIAEPVEGDGALSGLVGMIRDLTGWRRYALALVGGGLAALALPPLHWLVLLWPAFTVLVLLLRGAGGPLKAFWVSGAFGFGFFALGLYWVGIAFLVDVDRFGFVMPFAVAGLAAGMAVFTGLTGLVVYLSRTRGLAQVLMLAAAWVFFEWLRSWIFTGFPWNLMGTVWSPWPGMLQIVSVTGVWGLSLITVAAAAAPAAWFEANGPTGLRRGLVGLLVLSPALVWLGGDLRLASAPPLDGNMVPDTTLRLVQPAIEQSTKWDPDLRRKHLLDQMRLSRAPGFEKVSHLIWSETAVPFYLSSDDGLKQALSTIIPEGGFLVAGALRQGGTGDGPYNSLHVLDGQGEIRATYDKFHLVPFGEYAPFRDILDFEKLTAGSTDFRSGPGLQTLQVPGLPAFSPLICYEVIFPGNVIAGGATRPAFILNVTNDAWFGMSSGPYQHYANARLRAAEEGLPLVRSANNGISAVIDGYGREVAVLGLGETGILDSPLPKPLDRITLYATTGNSISLVLLLFVVFLSLFLRHFRI